VEDGAHPGSAARSLAQIPAEIQRLDPRREIIFYCKVGARSMFAASQVAAAGVRDVSNLSGGILRWIDDVDPTLPRY